MIPNPCGKCGSTLTLIDDFEYGGYAVFCTQCTNSGKIEPDRWKAKRSWNVDNKAVSAPSVARKVADSITSPPPVTQAIRRGRCSAESVAGNLRMEVPDAIAEIKEATTDGYGVQDRDGVLSLAPDLDGEPHVVPWDTGEPLDIACITDTHAGHKGFAGPELSDFIHWAYSMGVRHVCHSGDLVDSNYHHGQSYELRRKSMPGQIDALLSAMPVLDGLKYYCISGNHDEAYFRAIGAQVSEILCIFGAANGRMDIVNLGTTTGRIQFGKGPDAIRVMLSHSRNKKEVGRQRGGNKPDVFLQGHYHDYTVKDVHGILYCRPGGFQRTSRFYKTLGGQPTVGGTVITVCKSEEATTFDHCFRGYRQHETVWR